MHTATTTICLSRYPKRATQCKCIPGIRPLLLIIVWDSDLKLALNPSLSFVQPLSTVPFLSFWTLVTSKFLHATRSFAEPDDWTMSLSRKLSRGEFLIVHLSVSLQLCISFWSLAIFWAWLHGEGDMHIWAAIEFNSVYAWAVSVAEICAELPIWGHAWR